MANKKELKRRRLYANIGKWKLARIGHERRIANQKKKYTNIFEECIERMRPMCYGTVHTCNVMIWYNMVETGNPALMFFGELVDEKGKKRELNKMEVNALNMIYHEMRNEIIKMFGWGDKKIREMELMQEIIDRWRDMIANEDPTQLTWIRIAEEELSAIWASSLEGEPANIMETVVSLESAMGGKINIKINECSVAQFYGYIKMAEKMSQKSAA